LIAGSEPVRWPARLTLTATRDGSGATRVHARHDGPLRLLKTLYPEEPSGPDELIEDHWLWPVHKLLPFHMKHPITGEEMVASRWEGDARRDEERARKKAEAAG